MEMTGYEWYGELVTGTNQPDNHSPTHSYERQQSNGKWYTEGNIDKFMAQLIEKDAWYARRENRQQITTEAGMIARLSEGKALRFGDDWYAQIRITPPPLPPTPEPEWIECDCGHSVPIGTRMTTSTGTSCPDCYDRMSD